MWRSVALAVLSVVTLGFGVMYFNSGASIAQTEVGDLTDRIPNEGQVTTATPATQPADQDSAEGVPAAPAFPRVVIKGPQKPGEKKQEKTLKLGKLKVEATVVGGMSKTRLIMRFDNELNRILEGELVFPLPEGAVVTGYGLDIEGTLVEASTVEKHKARIAMEKEIRKGIDPGLVEFVSGNNYRTRVYPIPAMGSRTVMIEYQMPLVDDHYLFSLKLPNKLEIMEMDLEVMGNLNAAPKLEGAADLNLKPHADGYSMKFAREDYQPDLDLKLALPVLGRDARVLVEEFKPKGDWKQGTYFLVEQRSEPHVLNRPVPVPDHRRFGVAWDVSLSRKFVDLTAEYNLLQTHLDQLIKLNKTIWVEVQTFSDAKVEGRRFQLNQENAKDLVAWLKTRTYDGGTNLGALNLGDDTEGPLGGKLPKLGYWMLFTDGLGNLGEKSPKATKAVYTITNAAKANHTLLKKIANGSGGRYINMRSMKISSAAVSIGQSSPWSLLRVEYDPKQVTEVYPNQSTPVAGISRVAGKLLVEEAEIKLVYGYGPAAQKTIAVTLKKDQAGDSGLVAKAWAGMRLADLMLDEQANDQAIMKLGKAYEMVTPRTSLMVLETLEQHLEHQIVPAKSRTEMHAAYMEQIEKRRVAEEKTKEDKLKQVVAMWTQQVNWWEKEFKYAKDFKYRGNKKNKNGEAARGGEASVEEVDGVQPSLARPEPTPNTVPRPTSPTTESEQGQGGQEGQQGGFRGDQSRTRDAMAPADDESVDRLADMEPNEATIDEDRSIERNQINSSQASLNTINEKLSELNEELTKQSNLTRSVSLDQRLRNLDLRGQIVELEKELETQRGKQHEGKIKDIIKLMKREDSRRNAAAIELATPELRAGTQKALTEAKDKYAEYLKLRDQQLTDPAFYMAASQVFASSKQDVHAVRALTNLLELKVESVPLQRIVARRLQQLGRYELAVGLFDTILELRPEEPQSYRDLSLALMDLSRAQMKQGHATQAAVNAQRAMDLMNDVVIGTWDGRFPEIEVIALTEANDFAAEVGRWSADHAEAFADFKNPIDARLQKNLEADLRVVISWDTDATDIDLWVIEPSTEKAFYSHNRTTIGGAVSRDFTRGYGPEVYYVKRAMDGKYKIQCNFYGSSSQKITGGTTVSVTLFTNYGRANEKAQVTTVYLTGNKQVVDLGEIVMGE